MVRFASMSNGMFQAIATRALDADAQLSIAAAERRLSIKKAAHARCELTRGTSLSGARFMPASS